MRLLKLTLLALFFSVSSSKVALAVRYCDPKENTFNDAGNVISMLKCPIGYFCMQAPSFNSDTSYGICLPSIVIKQQCFLYNVVTSSLVRIVLIFAIIKTSFDFLKGSSDSGIKDLLRLLAVSVVLLSGPQLISIISGTSGDPCNYM